MYVALLFVWSDERTILWSILLTAPGLTQDEFETFACVADEEKTMHRPMHRRIVFLS